MIGFPQQQKKFAQIAIATLGSILDTQLSWESSKFQLARWSHGVVLVLVRNDPANPTRPPDGLVWKCGGPPSPLPLKHVWAVYPL